MPVRMKPISKAELINCFEAYRSIFKDWDVEHDTVFVRKKGLVKQSVSFEGLRSGAYRPSSYISVQTEPSSQLLHRVLDLKHRDILLRDHPRKWPDVAVEMKRQFVPSIGRDLDVSEVLTLSELDVEAGIAGNIQYCFGLAVLSLLLGHEEKSMRWCYAIRKQFEALARSPADWEVKYLQCSGQLFEAINSGKGMSYLKYISCGLV